MELTRKQRNTIYKKLLKIVCKDPSTKYGLCFYLFKMGYGCINFPELYAFKPVNKYSNDYWTSCDKKGWEKRISWIVKAIKQTN